MKKITAAKNSRYQRGLSIVEILVVIIILLFGILSVIKVFPSGFLVMRNSSNLSRADRIESGMLAKLSEGNNIPEGIYYPGKTAGTWDLTANPGDAEQLNSGSYVHNQPFNVPSSTSVNGQPFIPMVFLPFAPINSALGVTVNSTNWKETHAAGTLLTAGTTVDNSASETLKDGEYAVDTTDPTNGYEIIFPVEPYAQTFTVSCTKNGSNLGPYVVTLPPGANFPATSVILPAGNTTTAYNGYWDTLSDLMNSYGAPKVVGPLSWDDGSLKIYRPLLQRIFPAVVSTVAGQDPYEFQVDSSADIVSNSTNLGVLQFSPNAAPDALGHTLNVLVSYYTLDWSILHEDQNLSPGQPNTQLAVTDLLQAGTITADGKQAPTIMPGLTESVVGLSLDTGFAVTTENALLTELVSNFDYKKGQLDFKLGGATAYPHDRFFYRTTDDLALALQKAPAQFQLTGAAINLDSTASPTPNVYYIDTAFNSSIGADQVLFPPSNAGQSVQLRHVYWFDSGGARYSLGDVTVSISDKTESDGGYNVCYADITQAIANAALAESIAKGSPITPSTPGNGAFTIGGVGGVSSRAVCIWHESNKWKIHNVDTILN